MGDFDALGPTNRPKVLAIHLGLMQYPILSARMREVMREEIFSRNIIDEETFEHEVQTKAILSQKREGVNNPLEEEDEPVWQERLGKIRDILTEFYFALNFRSPEFRAVVQQVLGTKRHLGDRLPLTFNPEIAPWQMLFDQAKQLEGVAGKKKSRAEAQLREIIVVLTEGMLSDQLSFLGIARRTLTIHDLKWIYRHRVGRGKIGGKAGGMMLAQRVLHTPEPDDPVDYREVVSIPDSYFLGSDVNYEFVERNEQWDLVEFKYRPPEEIEETYAENTARVVAGRFPRFHRDRLREIIKGVGNAPLIVRSSSLLEDNLGHAFAGKYESFFCPNQGNVDENLEALLDAIKKVYACVLSPDALTYRRQRGLLDYDERMAVLIQRVEGERYGDYFFPAVAGVGFSHAPLRWNSRIDRSQGFLRMVAGLGTRAVDRLGDDHAQIIALSHPTLRPTKSSQEVVQYSQKYVDAINLRTNQIETVPVRKVLDHRYPALRHVASLLQDGELRPLVSTGLTLGKGQVVVDLAGVRTNRKLTEVMRAMLAKLARHYGTAVDIEFAVAFDRKAPTGFRIKLLQCRQQSRAVEQETNLPDVPDHDIVLASGRMVSNGRIEQIRYVIYVDPERYQTTTSSEDRGKIAVAIGKLNEILKDECFILVGPGRWGSSNTALGVPVRYGNIFNTRALVEVALPHGDHPPEASYGTHFFQDLVESNIHCLPVYPGEEGARFAFDFFRQRASALTDLLPAASELADDLQVIDIPATTGGRSLTIVMSDHEDRAIGFLS